MRRRSADCPSDLKLDRWLVGELTPVEQRGLQAHVADCGACEARRAALAESQRSFAREAPPFSALVGASPSPSRPPEVPQRAARRDRSRWLVAASALAALAIAFAVGKPWPGAGPSARDSAGSETRSKGALATLGWVVRRGERMFTGSAEQSLRAGDALRFTVSARAPVYIAILGIDTVGRVSAYYPDVGLMARVEPGPDQLLPAAIQFDAAPGEERLYGVFCSSALPVSEVKAALERSPDTPALAQGCTHERWLLHKESP
jgi:hypothetical protein